MGHRPWCRPLARLYMAEAARPELASRHSSSRVATHVATGVLTLALESKKGELEICHRVPTSSSCSSFSVYRSRSQIQAFVKGSGPLTPT